MNTLRELGRTGIRVSPVGLGCWQLSGGEGMAGRYWPALGEETERAVVGASLEAGVTWFDTAEFYGNGRSERALASALKAAGAAPGDVSIATKWMPLLRFAGNIRSTVGARLEALGGFPITLHQIHQRMSLSPVAAQMNAMADLVEAGSIRSVGVSNFGAGAMTAAHRALAKRGIPLASNQMSYSLLDRRIERNGVLETARRLGVTIIAYSPLAQGAVTGKFHGEPGKPVPVEGPRRIRRPFRPAALERSRPLVELLARVGAERGATAAQVSLAWLLARWGDSVVAIPGARSADQARANAESMKVELTPAEIREIDAASKAARP